jgi:hypothetical protein
MNLFAFDYSIKLNVDTESSYITGLSLSYTSFPEITNVEIAYDSLPPFEIIEEYQQKEIFNRVTYNEADEFFQFDINRIVNNMIQNRMRQKLPNFNYIFTNYKSKYHNQLFQRFLKDNYTLQLRTPVIMSKL